MLSSETLSVERRIMVCKKSFHCYVTIFSYWSCVGCDGSRSYLFRWDVGKRADIIGRRPIEATSTAKNYLGKWYSTLNDVDHWITGRCNSCNRFFCRPKKGVPKSKTCRFSMLATQATLFTTSTNTY